MSLSITMDEERWLGNVSHFTNTRTSLSNIWSTEKDRAISWFLSWINYRWQSEINEEIRSSNFFVFKDLKGEQERINKTNIIVCTPGRLLQHFDETWNFSCENLKMLSKTKRMQTKVHILFVFSYWWSRSNVRYGLCRDNAFDYSQFTWTKTDTTIFCNTNEVIHW